MKKVAIVLSGCGFKDGSEITETISSFIAIGQERATYACFAPSIHATSINHLTGANAHEVNVLEESARIARGEISDLKSLNEIDFDALLFPGGYGAAKNLCDWAQKGAKCQVLPEVEAIIKAFYKASKPIGAICIAPALVARVLGKEGITVTIGDDKETALEIQKTGALHEECPVNEYISDRNHKVLTTPAYMYATKPHEAYVGISKMIKELVEMA